jgi:alpha-L-rhamnosidase
MVHTFFLWRCSDITAKAAHALGKSEDEKYFSSLADKTSKAFQKRFFDEEKGSYGQYGGNIFALVLGLPEDQKSRVIRALEKDIAAIDYHLDTGIFGTQFFFEVLAENGLQDLAYKVMNQKTEPGYGWWIEQGATTTWEQWNGKGSRNHPMFGGGLTWFYRKLAGMNVDPENPGYKHIIFRPQPVEEITWASYSTLTPFGNSGIRWEKTDKTFSVSVVVPVGSTSTIYIPVKENSQITENGKETLNSGLIQFTGIKDGYAVYKTGSGQFIFNSAIKP